MQQLQERAACSKGLPMPSPAPCMCCPACAAHHLHALSTTLPARLLPPRTPYHRSQPLPAASCCAEASSQHIAAVRSEFDGAHSKMDAVQAEAAALGGALLETTASAAAANTALRRLALRP